MTQTSTAIAHPNIALVKYWGKRDVALNLPDGGSLSITLDELATRTTVRFDASLTVDSLVLGGVAAPDRLAPVSRVLDLVRAAAGMTSFAQVTTTNNFPTGAGLASSASGFAALVVAANAAAGAGLSSTQLSEYARRGSGSAARSLYGGFVELARGSAVDGSDCVASPLLERSAWPLDVVIAITATGPKAVSSGAGMELSRRTSPFYEAWAAGNDASLAAARSAVAQRDFEALAAVSEASCNAMHAVMISTVPSLLYWNSATVAAMHAVRDLRERDGRGVFYTVDAGPQVKAVCLPGQAAAVASVLGEIPGVLETRVVGLGEGARLVSGACADEGTTADSGTAGCAQRDRTSTAPNDNRSADHAAQDGVSADFSGKPPHVYPTDGVSAGRPPGGQN